MTRSPRLVVVGLLGLAVLVPSAAASGRGDADWQPDRHLGGPPGGYVVARDAPQTSDGFLGRVARLAGPVRRGAPGGPGPRRAQVVPGVTVQTWRARSRHGPVRLHLMTVRYRRPGITVDVANAGPVGRTAPTTSMLAREGAVAGVNGDFFDIGDTGAPLGLALDRQRGLLNGRRTGWNAAFSISRRGTPDLRTLAVRAAIVGRPGIDVTTVNSPSVEPGAVGLYNRAWGPLDGQRVVDGQRRGVRMVLVRDGRVVVNRLTRRRPLPHGTRLRGPMLVGRGDGARQLSGLRVGARVDVRRFVTGRPRMALTGDRFLVLDGVIGVTDDRERHPRTAVGIDRDTHALLLLAVDGRQRFSRGFTMVELAEAMIDLGADEALNLDGGGSTTMVARRRSGVLGVVNSPSDGFERPVANALAISYRRPRPQRGRGR